MTNSNDNITERVNEEDLQHIHGGCIGCGVVAVAAAKDSGSSFRKAAQTGSLKEATKGVVYTGIAKDSISHISPQVMPCEHCNRNGLQYLIVKSFP